MLLFPHKVIEVIACERESSFSYLPPFYLPYGEFSSSVFFFGLVASHRCLLFFIPYVYLETLKESPLRCSFSLDGALLTSSRFQGFYSFQSSWFEFSLDAAQGRPFLLSSFSTLCVSRGFSLPKNEAAFFQLLPKR